MIAALPAPSTIECPADAGVRGRRRRRDACDATVTLTFEDVTHAGHLRR